MKNLVTLFVGLILAFSYSYAQSLSIFDIDTSSFPIIKAKIFALDAEGKQVTGINTSDLSLTENGIPREIISVTCPPTKPADRISSTIVIDVSGSMSGAPLEIAKTVAKTWVNALPLGQSDCALVSFNGSNYFNQDFTTNRNKLLSAIDGLISDDGTDYNAAMINPVAGGILTAKVGKHRKVIVFITDGLPNNPPDEARIIAEANANGIMIHCITIGLPAHSSMVHFAEQTHGLLFENVKTEKEAKSIAQMLLGRSVYDFQPCELQWKGDIACERRFIDVVLNWSSLSATAKYFIPESGIAKLVLEPLGVRFINKPVGIKADTIVSITAVNADFNISGFTSSDLRFSIIPSSLTISKGETKEITLSFTPSDSSSCFAYIDIQNDRCAKKYFAASVYPKRKSTASGLKLTSPNGGEEFIVGTDTLIAWEGVLPQETVKLEYSYDNGATWNLITDTASGLKYVWKKVPRPTSAKCLIRATTKNNGIDIEWEKYYGSSNWDRPNVIIPTYNGYIVVGAIGSIGGDVEDYYGELDAWTLYMNKQGEPIWKKTLGGTSYDDGYSIIEMDDGEYVIGALTNSDDISIPKGIKGTTDYLIIKLDVNGNIIWSKRYGGSENEGLMSIIKTNDGGIVAVGASDSNDGDVVGSNDNGVSSNAWVVKLDSEGNIVWQITLGGSGDDIAYSVVQSTDNCFVIVGYTYSNDGNISNKQGEYDCWIAKISFDGELMWSKTLGGSQTDCLNNIKETQDFGFIVAGYSYSNDGDIIKNRGKKDALVAKLNGNGDVQWIKTIGGSNEDNANSIIQTDNGEYLFIGTTRSDDDDLSNNPKTNSLDHAWMVRLSSSGQINWSMKLVKPSREFGYSIQQTDDGGFITAGEAIGE